MGNNREEVEVELEVSADTWEAHWKRIRAWSLALGAARGFSATATEDPIIAVLDTPKSAEFLQDLGITSPHSDLGSSDRPREIPELARALDRHFAFEPFEQCGDEPDPFAQEALASLRWITSAELNQTVAQLPVFPAAAQKALHLLLTDNWNVSDLEFIAASDPVLASDMIRVSNSCLFGRREPVKTLGHAIAYMGGQRASAVLIAASVKRLFTTPRLSEIWNHSIEASEVARNIAKLSGRANPEEAFLAGLVHDIGRIAMAILPDSFHSQSRLLLRGGCELSLIERALCGSTHAELGAKVLERWKFPSNLIEAVRFHHRPEAFESSLAAVLYLTERFTSPAEDLPAAARSKAAVARLGFSFGDSLRIPPSGGMLDALRL